MTPARGRLYAGSAAVLWSTGGAAIKLAAVGPPSIALGRSIFCALTLLLVMPETRRGWDRAVWVAGLAYAVMSVSFIFANRLTTAGNAIFLQNLAPIWVLLASQRVLGERPSGRERLSVLLSMGGAGLFFLGDLTAGQLVGNLCALLASFAYAALLLAYRKLDTPRSLAATVCGNGIVVAAMLPIVLASPEAWSSRDLGVVFFLGAVQQAGGAVLFVRGIRGLTGVEGALLTLFEPLFSPLWAWLLVGETLGVAALFGAGVMLAGMLLRATAKPPSTPPRSPTNDR